LRALVIPFLEILCSMASTPSVWFGFIRLLPVRRGVRDCLTDQPVSSTDLVGPGYDIGRVESIGMKSPAAVGRTAMAVEFSVEGHLGRVILIDEVLSDSSGNLEALAN
jgi:hypothetical protein